MVLTIERLRLTLSQKVTGGFAVYIEHNVIAHIDLLPTSDLQAAHLLRYNGTVVRSGSACFPKGLYPTRYYLAELWARIISFRVYIILVSAYDILCLHLMDDMADLPIFRRGYQ